MSMLQLPDLFLLGLEISPELQARLPEVRRLALIESIYFMRKSMQDDAVDGAVLKLILDNVSTSPYLNEEQFQDAVLNVLVLQTQTQGPDTIQYLPSTNIQEAEVETEMSAMLVLANEMAAMALDKDWSGIVELCRFARYANVASALPPQSPDAKLQSFRQMVVEIFTRSRKIATVNLHRRQRLGQMIHEASTVDALVDVALDSLEDSQIFDAVQRNEVANHILGGRFDLLLQQDYFDCEEKRRRMVQLPDFGFISDSSTSSDDQEGTNENDESCVICLGELDAERTVLTCTHQFCTGCIRSWMENSSSCPVCRAEIEIVE